MPEARFTRACAAAGAAGFRQAETYLPGVATSTAVRATEPATDTVVLAAVPATAADVLIAAPATDAEAPTALPATDAAVPTASPAAENTAQACSATTAAAAASSLAIGSGVWFAIQTLSCQVLVELTRGVAAPFHPDA